MSSNDNIVIVGGGLAGAKVAESAREAGFEGAITIFGDEALRPYERPALSKGYLVGDTNEPEIYVHPEDFYDTHDIDLRLGATVVEIDRSAGEVVTADGARQPFDRLVLATGAEPRALPGGDIEGVHLLRTKTDSDALGAALRAAGHVTVIGAGWIGCEVAAAAKRLGTQVTMVDPLDVPLQRVVGTEIGESFRRIHAEEGVDLRMGVGVSSLTGTQRVEGVRLADDTAVDTDMVVVGIGVVPRTALAEQAGLTVDNGVRTDATLATDDPRIFAIGDIANAHHPHYGVGIRVEHWANALNQGITAGRNVLGAGEPYDRLPYFYSDQYDLGMEYVGYATAWDEVVVRGDAATRSFLAFWVQDGRVLAAMHANTWGIVDDLKALISSNAKVTVADLRNPDVALLDLAKPA